MNFGPVTGGLTVIMCAHREGMLIHPTFRAIGASIDHAIGEGHDVRIIVVLDRADKPTQDFVREALGPQGYLPIQCSASVLEVDFGDPGLARNAGIAASTTAYVGVLDADNLPSRTWLGEGIVVLQTQNAPSVVHPEMLIDFGERNEMWPQCPSDAGYFRLGNFYDCNYWDTVCIAHREVFERIPYAATRGETGLGYEDWHWNTRTLAEGFRHLVAPDTAYFYRLKRGESVNTESHAALRLVPPTPLLTDPAVARRTWDEELTRGGHRTKGRRRTALQKEVLRAWRKGAPPDLVVRTRRRRERWGARLLPDSVWPDHYRILNADLAGLTDAEALRHYRTVGRGQGRRTTLTPAEEAALSPEVFQPKHYRLLHADLAEMTDVEAAGHFLEYGRREGRQSKLSAAELRSLAQLDVDDYELAHADVRGLPADALVSHYLRHGRSENRKPVLTSTERGTYEACRVSDALRRDWATLHVVEPLIPMPTEEALRQLRLIGPPFNGDLTTASGVWWRLVDRLGSPRPRAFFFAPWIKMGGADLLLARYADFVSSARPDLEVVVITTQEPSTRPDLIPDGVVLIELPSLEGFEDLTHQQQRELVARLVIQYQPELVHIFNSASAFDAFEYYPQALAGHSRVFLSTFVIDYGPHGEIYCFLAKRPPDFLKSARGVIVDCQSFVDQMFDMWRLPRDKFVVHHQPVTVPEDVRRPAVKTSGEALRVVWAARFDRQKRLDVLADVVEATAAQGLPVEWHVYGTKVIATDPTIDDVILRLKAADVHFHPPFTRERPLPTSDYDAFISTSEAEGIPNTLLEVMAECLPVIAPLVGGIGEVLDETTGFPVKGCTEVAQYVDALRTIADRPDEARSRADQALTLMREHFSREAFERRVAATPGYLQAAEA